VSIWSYRSDLVTRTRVCSPRRLLIVCCCDHQINRDEREGQRVERNIWLMGKYHYQGVIRTIVEVQDAVYISEVPMYRQADGLSIPSQTVVGQKCISPFSVRFPTRHCTVGNAVRTPAPPLRIGSDKRKPKLFEASQDELSTPTK
jgi:hypothetical protein